ncbi:unnamed protein product, partial [Amoebophrya sp. A25]
AFYAWEEEVATLKKRILLLKSGTSAGGEAEESNDATTASSNSATSSGSRTDYSGTRPPPTEVSSKKSKSKQQLPFPVLPKPPWKTELKLSFSPSETIPEQFSLMHMCRKMTVESLPDLPHLLGPDPASLSLKLGLIRGSYALPLSTRGGLLGGKGSTAAQAQSSAFSLDVKRPDARVEATVCNREIQ